VLRNHMWWKKTVGTEEMGRGLWELCCNVAEEFCANLRPKLQSKGFLRDPAEDRKFMLEAMQLHIWIISLALEKDGSVLDVVHKIFGNWDATQQQGDASRTVEKRFAMFCNVLPSILARRGYADSGTHAEKPCHRSRRRSARCTREISHRKSGAAGPGLPFNLQRI
jgi:hypothetical protein